MRSVRTEPHHAVVVLRFTERNHLRWRMNLVEDVVEEHRTGSVAAANLRHDKSKPVLFENIFNQLHASTQVIARGDSEYDDGVVRFQTTGSHGLYSNFEWRVAAPSAPAAM